MLGKGRKVEQDIGRKMISTELFEQVTLKDWKNSWVLSVKIAGRSILGKLTKT